MFVHRPSVRQNLPSVRDAFQPTLISPIGVIAIVAFTGISLVGAGLAGYFGLVSGLSSTAIWSFVGAGGSLLAVEIAIGSVLLLKRFLVGKKDVDFTICVATLSVGDRLNALNVAYYAATNDIPGSQNFRADSSTFCSIQTEIVEKREERLKNEFSDFEQLGVDILCLQNPCLNPESDYLPNNYRMSRFTPTNSTRIFWNKDKLNFRKEYELGDNSCVLLREKASKTPILVVSVHVPEFPLNSSQEPKVQNAIKSVSKMVEDLKQVPYVTFVNGGFNCPRNDGENRSLHSCLEEAGFETHSTDAATSINPALGEVPLDYLYVRAPGFTHTVEDIVSGITWTNSASDHLPVIQEYSFSN